ncbi:MULTISPECIES: response regulator [unclassified Sinorhizobium]|uniref:response regulator n=1 Tax=unclassified Sinorhizobium TaxID=2613772 RepID=UPI00352396E5
MPDQISTTRHMSPARRVLIVEDEMLVAMLLEDMLTDLGHAVVGIATRVESALSLIITTAPDLAILDVNLAGEKSFPVAEALEKKGIPFVFATGYGQQGLEGNHVSRTVLTKPFHSRDLERALIVAIQPPSIPASHLSQPTEEKRR